MPPDPIRLRGAQRPHRLAHLVAFDHAHDLQRRLEGTEAGCAGGDARLRHVDDPEQLRQSVLLDLGGCPVSGVRGRIEARVACRVDIGESGHGAVGTAEQRAVDDDLVTGEDAELRKVSRGEQHLAEGDVVS